jgi:hypothetical protein
VGPGCSAEVESHHQAENGKDYGEDDCHGGGASGRWQPLIERTDVTNVSPSSENVGHHANEDQENT